MDKCHLLVIILYLTSFYVFPVEASTAYYAFKHTTSYRCHLIPENISGYMCNLDVHIKGERVNHIQGNHKNGETNSHVSIIKIHPSYHNYLPTFPDTFCKQFEKLEIIDIIEIEIKTIEDNSLEKCNDLRILQFTRNRIEEVPENLFKNNKNLEKIFMSFNFITFLPENLFSGLKNLEILDLAMNLIKFLPSAIFQDLRSLKELSLRANLI